MASAGERARPRRRHGRNRGLRLGGPLGRDGRGLRRAGDARPHDDGGRVDPRGAALQRLRGARQARSVRQDRAAARDLVEGVGERARVHVRAAQGGAVPERRSHDGERRRLQLRADPRAGAGGEAAPPRRRHEARASRQGPRPHDGARHPEAAQQRLAVRDDRARGRDPRQEGRGGDRDEAGRHRAVLGAGVHLRLQRHPRQEPDVLGHAGRRRQGHLPLLRRSERPRQRRARRRRGHHRQRARARAGQAVHGRPEEVHGRAGPDERQGPAEHEQLAEAAEQEDRATGDQLRDRPQGADQDRLCRLRQADRHACLACRPVVPRPLRHLPVRPGEGEEAPRAGRLPERLLAHAAGAADRLRDGVEHLRAGGAQAGGHHGSRCRRSTSRAGSTRSSGTRTTT